jgi:enamine deaminase RidA (YjgF/YER057c/UK114 family)
MAKKRKKKRTAAQSRANAGGWQPSYWMIVAAILFFFSAGLVVKIVFAPVSGAGIGSVNNQSASIGNAALESQVKLVAANFKCACGGCGELFLVDCTCDMPRGAKEEKDYISDRLRQGLTVDQVIDLVEKEYGHKIV